MGATEATTKIAIRTDADRDIAINAIRACSLCTTISITPAKASDELTSRMHCAIRCIAKQMTWDGETLNEEDWKRLLVGSLAGQRVVRAVDAGGWVVLDKRTSRMSGPQKFDLVEFMYAFGSQHGVIFDD